MAVSKQGMVDARVAGADLTGKLYHLVKLNTDAEAVLAGDEEVVYGVITEEATEGKSVTVQISGIAKVISSGSIDAGAVVCAAANGELKAGTTNRIGVARNGGEDGEIVEVNLDS